MSKEGMTDQEKFALAAEMIRGVAGPILERWFGPRCPDFQIGCQACQRWQLLDFLLDDSVFKRGLDRMLGCPRCGHTFPDCLGPLVPLHGSPGPLPDQLGCPGAGQIPREVKNGH